MSKATQSLLEALHGQLAEEMSKKLQSGEFTAADLNVIRQFLKDNGIEALATPGSPMAALTDSLPFASQGIGH